MLRKLSLLLLLGVPAFAQIQGNYSGNCDQGGNLVNTVSINSVTTVRQTFPGCTVQVNITGGVTATVNTVGTAVTWMSGTLFNGNGDWNTLPVIINSVPYVISTCASNVSCTLTSSAGTQTGVSFVMATAPAPIFSTQAGAVKPNPFTADASTGIFNFYAGTPLFNVVLSGGLSPNNIPSPFTIFSQQAPNPYNLVNPLVDISFQKAGYTFAQTCAFASAQRTTLVLTTPWLAVPSQTVSCPTSFTGVNGILQPGSSQVVSFSKFPECPGVQQCFDVSSGGAGSILSTGPTPYMRPEWFGATAQLVSGSLNGGVINSLALTAAQRALPVWPITNPQGLTMNMGTIKVANNGINSAYPLSSTFFLSPFTCLEGEDNATAYFVQDRVSFTGTYLFDTINYNGTGQTYNNNFNQCFKNLQIAVTNPTATSTIGGINWGSSLRSHLVDVRVSTSGIAFNVGQTDGATIDSAEADIFSVAGQSRLSGQCLVITNGNSVQFNNVMRNFKCVYAGAFGSPPLSGGFMPSFGDYMAHIGDGVQGWTLDGGNFENVVSGFYIGVGAHDIIIQNIQESQDCATSCAVQMGCANLIEPNSYNIHLSLTVANFKFAGCLGHLWQASTAYTTGQVFIIDALRARRSR